MRARYSVERRINQLEEDLEVKDRDTEEAEAQADWERQVALWQALVGTMRQDHAELVATEIIAYWNGEKPWYGPRGIRPCRLTVEAHRLVMEAFFDNLIGPLAMPPAVAEIYLLDEDAMPFHQCEDCGLNLPVRPPGNNPRSLKRCPLCEGRGGYRLYDYKHDPALQHLYREPIGATHAF